MSPPLVDVVVVAGLILSMAALFACLMVMATDLRLRHRAGTLSAALWRRADRQRAAPLRGIPTP